MGEERIRCSYCQELILADAKKCRFCGEWFAEKNKPSVSNKFQALRAPEVEQKPPVEPELEETVEEIHEEFVESPDKEFKIGYPKNKHQTPWLRIILALVYVGIIAWLAIYELNAHKVLRNAQISEGKQEYQSALEGYAKVIEGFQLSFAVIEARKGSRRVQESLGGDFDADEIYWLPFVVWPTCAVLLFLVFITRIIRLGIACLALLLLIVAILGSLFQLSLYNVISLGSMNKIVQELMANTVMVFVTSYMLLAATALMTLTSQKKIVLDKARLKKRNP
jgi:hypothetical protein